jgi:hypothetical protein
MSFTPAYGSFIQFYAWLTVVIIFSILIGIWLAVKSGDKYTVEDANAHAEEFGGIISESHGPLTTFLIVSYIIILVWTIVYFWVHWDEFVHLR